MKIRNRSFAGTGRLCRGVLFAFILAGLAVQAEATVYTINSTVNGSTYAASYDSSVNGFTTWSANGANQLALQSLYYSINGGSVSLLTGAIVNTGSSGFTSQYITATYATSAGSIADTLTINGNVLSEAIQFNNLTANPLNVSIFQYSDFVLGGSSAAGSQTVNMTPASGGGYATANQSGGDWRSPGMVMHLPALPVCKRIPAVLHLGPLSGWVATLTTLLWLPSILRRFLDMNFREACCRAIS